MTNESEITPSSPIDHMHFFQFVRNKRGIFSCNKRYFELLGSLLVTRLKKNIKMPVIWKFREDARKIVENVYTFFVGFKNVRTRLGSGCISDRSEQSHCSENYNQEG